MHKYEEETNAPQKTHGAAYYSVKCIACTQPRNRRARPEQEIKINSGRYGTRSVPVILVIATEDLHGRCDRYEKLIASAVSNIVSVSHTFNLVRLWTTC